MAITKILIDNSFLVKEADRSSLKTAVAAGASTISVVSINKFATDKILLVGEFGSEKSEIVKTHAATAPSGNTVTLATNLVHAHPFGTNVYLIDYDQYELSHSSTSDGAKTLLTTTLGSGLIVVDPEKTETLYADTQFLTGFYFVRKKETVGGTFSTYSDPIPLAGYPPNTVGFMLEKSLREIRTTLSPILTQADCLDFINEGIRLIQGKQIRWPEHQKFDYVVGQVHRGQMAVTLPTDLYDNNTNKSILGFRLGVGSNLQYISPTEFDDALSGVAKSNVRTEALVGATTIGIDNSYDFEDTGFVNVYINNVKHTFTYSGVTRDDETGGTAALTGIPASGEGSVTVVVPVGTTVWQHEKEGVPSVYTLRNGVAELYPLPDDQNDNANVYMDYFTVASIVDSDSDVIDFQRYDMVKDYLTWRIKMKVFNDGNLDVKDGYYFQFKEKLNDAIRNSVSYSNKAKPRVNQMIRRRFRGR